MGSVYFKVPRMKPYSWYLVSSWLFVVTLLEGGTGSMAGAVRDGSTQQPLVGANVVILGTDLGAATDEQGNFIITDLEPGSYHVKAMMIGYESAIKLNVHVMPERQTIITFQLSLSAVELEAVQVTRSFFKKEPDVFTSSRTVDLEEIRSDPGGVYDIQKMMQSLPAVVSGADQENEIIVRGGAPGENLFVMDEIEIPNPNHFGFQGSGGGPINMVNTEFVDQVELIAGAFPAQYGGKASSVMNIQLREGSREKFNLDMEMSMAGFGFTTEGPLANKRGSYLASIRKSYLDLVIKDIGVSAVPEYWNAQAKVVYDLNTRHKLIFNLLYGEDGIAIRDGRNPYTRGAENVDAGGDQYSWGLLLKSLWSKSLLTRLTLYQNMNHWNTDVFNIRVDQSRQRYYYNHDREGELALKGDLLKRFNRNLEVNTGLQIKEVKVDYDTHSDSSTRDIYWYSKPASPEVLQLITSPGEFYGEIFPIITNRDSVIQESDSLWAYYWKGQTVRSGLVGHDTVYGEWTRDRVETFFRINGFGSVKWRPSARSTINTGLHLYYTEFNDQLSVEPRLGWSYNLTENTALNLAYGKHYQLPAYTVLINGESGRYLKNKFTEQVVLGLERLIGSDIRAVVEVYRKNYHDLVRTNADTTADPRDRWGGFNNAGSGYSQGVEFFLQKKLAQRFWGTVSYSHYIAQARDVRVRDHVEYYDWDFDFRDVATLTGGYKFQFHKQPWYRRLKKRPWWPAVAWLPLAPADEFEIGLRFRYVGGKPVTPKTYDFIHGLWYLDPTQPLNSQRLREYRRLDIMITQRNFFKHSSLSVFIDIQNVFNTDNIWDIQYNSDGTATEVLQFKTIPVGGFIWEF